MNQKEKLAHSTEHVFAQALKEIYGTAVTLAVGHITENHFSADFKTSFKFGEEEFEKVEKKMLEIISRKSSIKKEVIDVEKAKELFADNPFKLEWINEHLAKEKELTVYRTGEEYVDLCGGMHVENTSEIVAFRLVSVTGAYWRGNAENEMLTRVYGISFESKEELDEYLALKEKEKESDHRKIGKEMSLFTFDEEVGPGLPMWLPNGTIIIDELENLAKETEKSYGYQRVRTPHITKESLYLKSGHLPYYKDSMFPPMELDNEKYYLKPMNCPHHHKVYLAEPRSYKDLPIRYAEYGHCYRYEDSGSLFGLMRVRSLCMNDAHIYCTEENFEDEFLKVIQMYLYYFKIFGISKFQMRLSKHSQEGLGKKYVNNPELWKKTEDYVRKILIKSEVPFVEAEDEAAFYGPKIDVQIFSAIGREFTLSTNQLDFAVPERFGLEYKDADGNLKTPICIHRAPLSTHERFVGFLTEHFSGKFPLWLAPVQVQILPVSSTKHSSYAREISEILEKSGIRTRVDDSSETLENRIRKSSALKPPYMLVIGDKEIENNQVNIRIRGVENTSNMSVDSFKELVSTKIKSRDLNL